MIRVDDSRVAEAVLVVGVAPQARQSRYTSHQRPVSHPTVPRPARAKRAAMDDHQSWVDVVQNLYAKTQLLERPRLEVGQQHVGAARQALDQFDTFAAAEVHAHAPAPTVPDREMHRRDARAIGKFPALDLDHVRAQLAEEPG